MPLYPLGWPSAKRLKASLILLIGLAYFEGIIFSLITDQFNMNSLYVGSIIALLEAGLFIYIIIERTERNLAESSIVITVGLGLVCLIGSAILVVLLEY